MVAHEFTNDAVTKRFLTRAGPGVSHTRRRHALRRRVSVAGRPGRKTSPSPPGRCAGSASRSGRTACPRGRRPSHRAGTRRQRRERRGSCARSSRRARRRAPSVDRTASREQRGARAADAIAARARIDARLEQRFACIDVAGADDDLAAEERRLDGDPAAPQRGVQMRAVEAVVEGLEAEAGEQRRRRRGVGRRRPDDGAEAARIGEAQRAARRDEVEVVVRAGLGASRRRRRAIRTCRGASAGRRDRARARGTCRAGSPRRRVARRSPRGSRRAASAAACRRARQSRAHRGFDRRS